MRRILCAILIAAASALAADEVPQAVAALRHLTPRPDQGPFSWTNGPYLYDAAGNIQGIGSEQFVYDNIGRLQSATVRGPDLTTLQTQTFLYDNYGNLTSTSKLGQTVSLPVDVLTNRLTIATYDAAGNLTISGTEHFGHDAVGMLNTIRVGSDVAPRIVYAYTADDERLFAFDVSTGTTHWTVRGLDHKVLRDFRQNGSAWSVERDYVYRDGLLLAALKPGGAVEHYTLDHLGTPRLITDAAGYKIGYHAYWPFGEEWSPGNAQEANPLKFTGHERDGDPSGGIMGLDYMHARYYRGGWGRFLSVDRSSRSLRQDNPQTGNRYAYARNSPVNRLDRDGLIDVRSTEERQVTETPTVLATSADLADTIAKEVEYGAIFGDNGKVTSGIFTSGRPDGVNALLGIDLTPNGPRVKGTDVLPSHSMHTHLPEGKYRMGQTPMNFIATAPGEPGPGDPELARNTVPAFILVPSRQELLKLDTTGACNVLLSAGDYDAWMRRAQKARVQAAEEKKAQKKE